MYTLGLNMFTRKSRIAALIVTIFIGACAGSTLPPLSGMADQVFVAEPVLGKAGVPVDVSYKIEGTPAVGLPISLELTLLPRVSANSLTIEIPPTDDFTIDVADVGLTILNPKALQSYKVTVFVTPRNATIGNLKILVWLDLPDARYAGVFSIVMGGNVGKLGTGSQKQPNVKP